MDLSPADRTAAVAAVTGTLLERSSRLTRLLASFGPRELSRTEAGLLLTVLDAPRRITELADTEALAQPTVTRLVDRLQERGLVARERQSTDGRVVLVVITSAGRAALEASRVQLGNLLREVMDDLDDGEVLQLAAATASMGHLIDTLQRRRGVA